MGKHTVSSCPENPDHVRVLQRGEITTGPTLSYPKRRFSLSSSTSFRLFRCSNPLTMSVPLLFDLHDSFFCSPSISLILSPFSLVPPIPGQIPPPLLRPLNHDISTILVVQLARSWDGRTVWRKDLACSYLTREWICTSFRDLWLFSV